MTVMRIRDLVLIAISGLLFFAGSVAASDKAEQKIAKVMNDFHLAASHADGDLYFSLFTEDAVFIGTDATERWSIDEFKAFAEPYFSQGQGWTYVPQERHIHILPTGAAARFDEILSNESYGTCRGTGVVELTSVGWRISQYTLTIPIPNELSREVVARIKELETTAPDNATEQPLTVFLVRHAEKVDESDTSELSPSGKIRAEQLNEVLRDAEITHIYSSDFVRTRNTAAPLAKRLGLDVELYDANDLEALAEQLKNLDGCHLVVGHSNTTPAVVELLGGDLGSEIEQYAKYDQLYIVFRSTDDTVSTTIVRYGQILDP